MIPKLKNGIALFALVQIFFVQWVGHYPEWIEIYYSEGIYPIIAMFLRTLFGWIPFSVGDLGYAILVVISIRYLVFHKHEIVKKPLNFIRDIVMIFSSVFFVFHLFWGMNYYRKPVISKFDIPESIGANHVSAFTDKLIKRTNKLQYDLTTDSLLAVVLPYSKSEVFELTSSSYENIEKTYPFLKYERPSLKSSLFSKMLSYMGYGGYLNPFTNEAQVNGLLPLYRLPVVSGHEVGHQLGYSSETDTNFIGILTIAHSEDPYYQYAAHSYALAYILNLWQQKDEPTFKKYIQQLNPGVKKNYQEIADFWMFHENPLEPIFKSVFDTFLKVNNQELGIQSYSKVTDLLLRYDYHIGL
ncbi:MAG: DUF3810 domain-containing protein [Croceitalea sp.]|nr:DUF3810 domain-containing protein [Croceitalea sp.]